MSSHERDLHAIFILVATHVAESNIRHRRLISERWMQICPGADEVLAEHSMLHGTHLTMELDPLSGHMSWRNPEGLYSISVQVVSDDKTNIIVSGESEQLPILKEVLGVPVQLATFRGALERMEKRLMPKPAGF